MKVFTTVNPDSLSNIYIVTDNEQINGVIIDPGSFSINVYKLVKHIGVNIKKIIITHNEESKVNGIPMINKIFDTEIYVNRDSIKDFNSIKIKNNSIITEGELIFKILETPAHTYDSVSILIDNALFVGDIMQAGRLSSINGQKIPSEFELRIIEKTILSLPDNTIIYPSRGPATTVRIEKEFNPFLTKRIKNVSKR